MKSRYSKQLVLLLFAFCSFAGNLNAQACDGTSPFHLNAYILTDPTNVINTGDSNFDGNNIVATSDGAPLDYTLFDPTDLCCHDTYRYDIFALQLAVDNMLNPACCDGLTVLLEVINGTTYPPGETFCTVLNAGGISSGADVVGINDILFLSSVFGGQNTVESIDYLFFTLNQLSASGCVGTTICASTVVNSCGTVEELCGSLSPPIVVVDVQDLTCPSFCFTSSATVTVSNISNPYSILWSTGDMGPTIEDECAGDYFVTVTDLITGGTTTVDFTISEPPTTNPVITSVVNASSPGTCDGQATLVIIGGTPPFTTIWQSGDPNQPVTVSPDGLTATGLCPDVSNVVFVIDDLGCGTGAAVAITVVPTIGEWGLICLTLLFLIIGLTYLFEPKRIELRIERVLGA